MLHTTEIPHKAYVAGSSNHCVYIYIYIFSNGYQTLPHQLCEIFVEYLCGTYHYSFGLYFKILKKNYKIIQTNYVDGNLIQMFFVRYLWDVCVVRSITLLAHTFKILNKLIRSSKPTLQMAIRSKCSDKSNLDKRVK